MSCSCATTRGDGRPILILQSITLVWMLTECGLSLLAAVRAHSPAMFAFGLDSLIELLSAVLVLVAPRLPERVVDRLAGVFLYLLAVAVAGISVASLTGHLATESSLLGLAITAAALLVMPLLAYGKRRLAQRNANHALAADAVQSATCAWLALVSLLGLAARAFWQIAWADALAALVAIPILWLEARRAMRGEGCGCGQ